MKRQGTIVRFDTERGFGFLRCHHTPADVFFHVRDFNDRDGPPTPGRLVNFEEIHVGGKGPRAVAVRPAGATASRGAARRGRTAAAANATTATTATTATSRRQPSASLPLWTLGVLLECMLLGWCIQQGRLPLIVLVPGLLLNLATFWIYWHDKHAAGRGAWRVREDHLHALSLAGAWPAAWWAQQLLRHKSRKPRFRATEAAVVLTHLAALAGFAAWPWISR